MFDVETTPEGPAPAPAPKVPAAAPAEVTNPAGARSQAPSAFARLGLSLPWVLLLATTGALVASHSEKLRPSPAPDPVTAKLTAAVKLYGPELLRARAAGWRAAATGLEAGKSFDEVHTIDSDAFEKARRASFETLVGPAVAAIVPPGTDPLSPKQRADLVAAFRAGADVFDPQKPAKARWSVGSVVRSGWVDNTAERLKLVEWLPHRTLKLAAPALWVGDNAKPDNVFLYRAWREVLKDYPNYPAQQIGDCTSFGSGHCLDLLQCVEIATGKQPIGYEETSTEAIYGMGRELAHMLGRGDGCYGVAVAQALTDLGAVPRKLVGAYSGKRAKDWGYSGVPAEIKAEAAKHKLGGTTLVTTLDEADNALWNSYPFIICSNQGFTLKRDQDGLCEASGSWAHCMFVAGRRVRAGEVQYLVCNSWGSQMPTGPLADDQPPFSFWARGKVVARMLAGQDSLAFSRFGGFEVRPVPKRWTYGDFAGPSPVGSN